VQDGEPKQGAMKDVYFTTDGTHAVGFFKSGADPTARMRLEKIVGSYRSGLLDGPAGEFWQSRFCWPVDVVTAPDGRIGVVSPKYGEQFFFTAGSINGDFLGIRGCEKEGKWFSSLRNRSRLDPSEKGTWREYLRVCLNLSRAVRRMHASGLAHSDLSYRNVLINPINGSACVIDIDGLVVDGVFPAEVMGTADFIAPEVMATSHLNVGDPMRKHPSPATDKHALAVLNYMYLLYRHPLKGRKVHDAEPGRDDALAMGERAIWNEDPSDQSNRVNPGDLLPAEIPLGDPAKVPYTVVGPYLAPLFEKSFTVGLRQPHLRPVPKEWEIALLQTLDSIVPCANAACEQKWFAYNDAGNVTCPFCGTKVAGSFPVLNPYVRISDGSYKAESRKFVIYDGMQLLPWHVYRDVTPDENIAPEHLKRLGRFSRQGGEWVLLNEALPGVVIAEPSGERTPVPVGQTVALTPDRRILLSPEPNGRLIRVELIGG